MLIGERLKYVARLALLAASVLTRPSLAREFEARLLEGSERNGVWGTKEFQVHVNELGNLRRVKVGGKEIISQAAALYTSPKPPGSNKGIRTVQGEGYGKRGLTVEKPEMTTRDENGKRVFEFGLLVANQQVLDGRPLCRVSERVVITPTGEIHVRYDCHWLATVRWYMFAHLLMFEKEQCGSRDYLALAGDRTFAGTLEPGPVLERRIRFVKFEQLTIRTEVGPCHLVWHEEANCSFHWSKNIQLSFSPAAVPRRGFIYKGQKATISYSILLPVSQQ